MHDTTNDLYTLYGWEVSPYTSKVRAYLQYKRIPFKTVVPNIITLKRFIEPTVGKIIMPVVTGADSEALQDSSFIIKKLEQRYPENPIIPNTPKQALVSMLMELCGDEWLPMAALHYRWNYPENNHFILNEFGKSAFPYLPRFIQRKAASLTIVEKLKAYLPMLGITKVMENALEQNTHTILDALNQHFEQHAYLLGNSPCLGDFSLFGPLYSHLHRDPYPKNLVSNYPNTLDWLERLKNNSNQTPNGFLDNDEVPETLFSLIKLIIEQQLPLIKDCIHAINVWVKEHPDKEKIPLWLGDTELKINNLTERRYNLSYPYLKFQYISDFYQALSTNDKIQIDHLLEDSQSSEFGLIQLLKTPLQQRVVLKRCKLYLE
jgi:glutathione S-transferase